MKRFTFAACLPFALFAALALFAVGCATPGSVSVSEGKKDPGKYRYVCNCGPDCKCGSNAAEPGNCTCGKPMVRKKVLAEGVGTYHVCGCPDCNCDAINPKDSSQCSCGKALKPYPKRGLSHCSCPGCGCDMQANVPGKCTCGKDMKAQ